MTSRTATPVLLTRRPVPAATSGRSGPIRRLLDRALSLVRSVNQSPVDPAQRDREALRLSIWALGYSGLAREAARLFDQARRARPHPGVSRTA
jgi:hypothetical protein